MKKKRLLLILLFLLLIPSGILLISPYPRQLVFGPKIQGVPLCAWQESFRQNDVLRIPPGDGSLWNRFLDWFQTGNSSLALDWEALSPSEQEHVLLSLLTDPDRYTRRATVGLLAKSESRRVILAVAQLLDDPQENVRERAAEAVRHWRENLPDAAAEALAKTDPARFAKKKSSP